jgi:hypothetical protein
MGNRDILPAESIQQTASQPPAVDPGANGQYGAYLATLGGCRDCHGQDLTGGKSPEPGAPHAPDITLNGVAGAWSPETFIAAVRTMKGVGMPWDELKPLADSDLQAIFLCLQSLPAK